MVQYNQKTTPATTATLASLYNIAENGNQTADKMAADCEIPSNEFILGKSSPSKSLGIGANPSNLSENPSSSASEKTGQGE